MRPRRPLPPVEQVRPGLWSVPVPLPGLPRYVVVYVLETDRGPYLIDTGWDDEDSYAGLEQGLAELGCAVRDVQGVIATHAHVDHYGLAARIREASGAWVSLHPLDAAVLDEWERDVGERKLEVLMDAGAPDDVVQEAAAQARFGERTAIPRPDPLLDDGDEPPVPGRHLRAVWTPGHTPGHLCFWDAQRDLLFSGDHVLPRFPVGMHEAGFHGDPLTDFLDSLDRLGQLDPDEVLPAHEHRFTEFAPRLRTLRAHHERRIAAALAAVRAGASTVWEVAAATARGRPLTELRGFPLHSALVDTKACLSALRTRGELRARPPRPGHPARWSPA
jgi:glyoxylase-like metal-dependent hydrolase (beta-lactamase superfamily II)